MQTMQQPLSLYDPLNQQHGDSLFNPDDDIKRENIVKLFIGGLNYVTLQSDVKAYFETFGKVIECSVLYDKETRKSKCYAFLTLEDVKGNLKDRVQNRKHEINGKIVDVKFAVEGKEKEEMMDDKKKLFVGGLDPHTTGEDLEKFFSKYGPVKEASVLYDQDRGVSRCFGFIKLEHKETVDILVKEQRFNYNGKMIEVKVAVPKSQQKPKTVVSKSGVDVVLNFRSSKPFLKGKRERD
jgi:RNA-binding protein Musashi